MKERPILFSTPMVRAILQGRKSQTRRIIKPQPESVDHINHKMIPYNGSIEFLQRNLKCPYGKPGDILWVKETWTPGHSYLLDDKSKKYWVFKDGGQKYSDGTYCPPLKRYSKGAFDNIKWKPSIFMPKVASRIKLLIKDVRVERVQDITEDDAVAEGIESSNEFQSNQGYLHQYKDYIVGDFALDAANSYQTLWESINGKGSWEKNPWVFVIKFEKI